MQHFSGLAQQTGGFVPWSLATAPSFTPWSPEEVPAPANEAEPQDDGFIEAIRDEAYAAGFAAGRAAREDDLAPEREALKRLGESLQSLKPEPTGPLALLLVETVDRLVRQVVGDVAIDANLLLARANAAAALIAEEARPSVIRLNPADHARLSGASLPLPMTADPAVASGSVVVETAAGWVEDGIAARLDAVRAALMRIE